MKNVTSIDISAAVRILSCIHIGLHIFSFTLQSRTLQESLANAKVSAGQHCVYEGHLAKKSKANERKEHNIEKYI